jgi:endoglucanase
MAHRIRRTLGLLAAVAALAAAAAFAADLKSLVRDLHAVPSTTGNEEMLAAKVRASLPKGLAVEEDGLGTIAVRLAGPDGPTLVLAGLDGYGHMVSGIRPDGHLTVDRPVAPPHGRFDAYLLGQPVVVSTARGPVPGVVAQPALHLLTQERRRLLVDGFSLENAFIDIGARSEREARAKGVELLDPVTAPAVLTELAGGKWSGPSLGMKAVAAVLVDAASAPRPSAAGGEVIVAWAAQTKFAARGRGARPPLGAARARAKWRPRRAVLVDVVAAGKDEAGPVLGRGPVLVPAGTSPLARALAALAAAEGLPLQSPSGPGSPLALPFSDPPSEAVTLALPVRYLNTPSETISLQDLQALRDLLAAFLTKGEGR